MVIIKNNLAARMKRYLIIYREDREAHCDPDYGYINRLMIDDKEFPNGTTDWEVLKIARAREVKNLLEDRNTASEGILNRILVRVVQVAREIPIAAASYSDP